VLALVDGFEPNSGAADPMKYDPSVHKRRSLRLRNYDYSMAGAYFVTLCTHRRDCLFGDVTRGAMALNDAGRMVESVWLELPVRFPRLELDLFVAMPNHFHGIVVLHGERDQTRPVATEQQSNGSGVQDPGQARRGESCIRPLSVAGEMAPLGETGRSDGEGRSQKEGRSQGSPLREIDQSPSVGANLVFARSTEIDQTACAGPNLVSAPSGEMSQTACVGADLVFAPVEEQEPNHRCGHRHRVHPSGTRPGSLGRIIQAFKSITSREYMKGIEQYAWPTFSGRLWQRNYYEHVIRNQNDLDRVREYIVNNPTQWETDRENPNSMTPRRSEYSVAGASTRRGHETEK